MVLAEENAEQKKNGEENFISVCDQDHAPSGSRFDFRFRFSGPTDLGRRRRLRDEGGTHSAHINSTRPPPH